MGCCPLEGRNSVHLGATQTELIGCAQGRRLLLLGPSSPPVHERSPDSQQRGRVLEHDGLRGHGPRRNYVVASQPFPPLLCPSADDTCILNFSVDAYPLEKFALAPLALDQPDRRARSSNSKRDARKPGAAANVGDHGSGFHSVDLERRKRVRNVSIHRPLHLANSRWGMRVVLEPSKDNHELR